MGDFQYRIPPKANRYWSRPKARIYECNMRDVERVYQDSYKQYQAEKDFRLRGDRAWSADKTDRFAHLRAGPVHRRETSTGPSSSRSLVDQILARTANSEEDSASQATTSPVREISRPVPPYDPQKENASLEERLARLKKLREELGLPTDSQASKNTLRESSTHSTKTTSAVSNDIDSSSYKSERSSRLSSRTGASAANDDNSYKADRSPRLSSRTRAGAANDESSSSYSFRSERSAKVNGSTEDFKLTPRPERKREEINLTPKMERKSEKKTERFSKLSATSAASSSPPTGRTRKTVKTTEALDFDADDDDSLMKMMKKLPSSQDILDRISKMELDD